MDVQPGQRYLSLASNHTQPAVWEVVRLYRHDPGILHAALARDGRRNDLKTLSCAVLTDASHFRLLKERA
ncbi:MAG: hypothetical protein R3316_11735 [Rhodovibrionaceae bacterium]|nr:hypothetical protein [Rhodovibrionaceae bacterium]